MNRKMRLAAAGLTVGATAVAAWFGFQPAQLRPTRGETRAATHAVSAEEVSSEPATTPAAATTAATIETHRWEHNPELDNAKQLLKDGKKPEARTMLTKLILPAPEGPVREEMRKMLDEINKELFFSSAPSPDSVVVEVQQDDTLSGIAKQQGRDVYFTEVIMLVNHISDARRIRAHQKLKIPNGTFSAVVQKQAHRLIILFNGEYIKEYPVALGAPDSPTPEGAFVLDIGKAKDPTWTAPDGQVYKFGDPKNILGTRWMPFNNTEDHHGLGIHGTTDPESLGKDVSNGCIRMLNDDVNEIFGMLAPGNRVEITK
jgi:lipoprotein-anchoring transpeptidase ErfK/SrfK